MALLDNTVANMYLLDRYNNVATTPPDRPLGDLLNSIAIASGVSSAVRDLFVDPVNGNDDNDGLVATQVVGTEQGPVQSIQLAVLMFKLPLFQTWARNANRTIHVKHTVGMPKITEQVVIPPHVGEGILVIEGEEDVLFTGLVENGALAPIAGFETRQRLTFTTAPLTPAALAKKACVRLQDRSLCENDLDSCLEDLPIIDNGAGTVDVEAFDPGIYTAFQYANGTVVDIVATLIEWGLDAPVANRAVMQRTSITNMGSPLIVRGFCAENDDTLAFFNTCFLSNVGNGVGAFGANVGLNRCMSGGTSFWASLTYGDSMVSAHLGELDSIYYPVSYAKIAQIWNSVMESSIQQLNINDVDSLGIYGLSVEQSGGFIALLLLQSHASILAGLAADVRGGPLDVYNQSTATILALTVENAGATPALGVGSSSAGSDRARGFSAVNIPDGTRVAGSTGNTDVGAEVALQSNLCITGVPTLTGTVNDLRVGAAAARAWGAGNQTDATKLARFEAL